MQEPQGQRDGLASVGCKRQHAEVTQHTLTRTRAPTRSPGDFELMPLPESVTAVRPIQRNQLPTSPALRPWLRSTREICVVVWPEKGKLLVLRVRHPEKHNADAAPVP